MLKKPNFSDIKLETFTNSLKERLKENLQTIELLLETTPYNWDSLMQPLDDMDDALNQMWSPVSHLHSVVNNEKLREVYQACVEALSDYGTQIGQNKKLYEAIKSISPRNDTEKKILEDEIKGFELSGVGLVGEAKEAFKKIQARLSTLSTQFENNLLDATNNWKKVVTDSQLLSGMPEHAVNTAKEKTKEDDSWELSLDFPCFHAVMTCADDESLRKEMYEAFTTRASDVGPHDRALDNSAIIEETLKLRHQKAALLGFKNYAELSLAKKMAPSTDKVSEFLLSLCDRGLKQAQQEYKNLETFAGRKLNAWDVGYYSEKQRLKDFNLSQEELRPYFPESQALKGMFDIVHKLYGITVKEQKNVDTWHPDVRFYMLIDSAGTECGGVYMDLYARAHKRGGAWMDDCVCYRELPGGDIQRPIAYLTCNFAPPSADKEACFSHDEVVTLFHEFGHCLHHLLTKVGYLSASGINGVEWDAVELPSQFFENYCWHKEGIALVSRHIDSGEPLSDELFGRLEKAKNFQSAMAMMRQLEFSLFDFQTHLHDNENDYQNVMDVLRGIKAKYAVTPSTETNRFPHQFSHIFAGGYAAGYYSYKWAEVLACDAFGRFLEEGIFSKEVGQSFLNEVLSKGSSRPALESFIAFRGREPDVEALLQMEGIA